MGCQWCRILSIVLQGIIGVWDSGVKFRGVGVRYRDFMRPNGAALLARILEAGDLSVFCVAGGSCDVAVVLGCSPVQAALTCGSGVDFMHMP